MRNEKSHSEINTAQRNDFIHGKGKVYSNNKHYHYHNNRNGFPPMHHLADFIFRFTQKNIQVLQKNKLRMCQFCL